MLDNLLMKSLFAAAKREGHDLNDPTVQLKLTQRKNQIEAMLADFIGKQTSHCGCSGESKKQTEE